MTSEIIEVCEGLTVEIHIAEKTMRVYRRLPSGVLQGLAVAGGVFRSRALFLCPGSEEIVFLPPVAERLRVLLPEVLT